jgi:hypothetical protein
MGRGRPRGSKNKVRTEAREILENSSRALVRRALSEALREGGPILRQLLSYVLGPPKANPITIGKIRTETAADVSKATQVVIRKATDGEITAAEGNDLAALLELRRRAIETDDHDKRLRELESTK